MLDWIDFVLFLVVLLWFLKRKREVCIVYASQSGSAEQLAESLKNDFLSCGVNALYMNSKDFELKSSFICFVVSTFGDGEPPDDASELLDKLRALDLKNLNYALFGLGSTNYPKFNKFSKDLERVLREKNANRIGPKGEGDDQNDLDEEFFNWKKECWPCFEKVFKKRLLSTKTCYSFKIQPPKKHFSYPPYNLQNPFYANCKVEVKNSIIYAEFDLKNSKITYSPGDHLAVYPENPIIEVKKLLKAAEFTPQELQQVFSLSGSPFPTELTWELLFTRYLDITIVPTLQTIRKWAKYINLIDKYQSIVLQHATVADLLTKYNIKLPRILLIESFKRIQPRYYSIASSLQYLKVPSVQICASKVNYLKNGKQIIGLCTGYLSSKPANVHVAVRRSMFKLPKNRKSSVIMIGPGTGVAPFRGFLQERQGTKCGEMMLFHGCRTMDRFIYENDFKNFQEKLLTEFHLALSSQKTYVQDKMEQKKEIIQQMIQNGAFIYVCGSTKVGDTMRQWFSKITQVAKLKQTGRYLEDVW